MQKLVRATFNFRVGKMTFELESNNNNTVKFEGGYLKDSVGHSTWVKECDVVLENDTLYFSGSYLEKFDVSGWRKQYGEEHLSRMIDNIRFVLLACKEEIELEERKELTLLSMKEILKGDSSPRIELLLERKSKVFGDEQILFAIEECGAPYFKKNTIDGFKSDYQVINGAWLFSYGSFNSVKVIVPSRFNKKGQFSDCLKKIKSYYDEYLAWMKKERESNDYEYSEDDDEN